MKENLKTLFEKYIDYCQFSRKLRNETLRGYIETFKRFTSVMSEVDSVDVLSTDLMTTFFKRLQIQPRIVGRGIEKTGVKDSTIKTYWSKLNSFFEWLVLNKHVQENPLSIIKPPEVVYGDLPALKKHDMEKIYSSITSTSKSHLMFTRDRAMVDTLFYTGARKTELLSLRVMDVDMMKGTLTIRGETSKSKRTREIPINRSLMTHLNDYIKERVKKNYKTQNLFVSTTEDVGLTSHGLKHWVKRLNESSGVKFHLHQFRHTFASSLARSDVSSIKIKKLLGHTDLRMTERYLRSLGVEDMRDDVGKLSIGNMV